jgi:hypothetical protein
MVGLTEAVVGCPGNLQSITTTVIGHQCLGNIQATWIEVRTRSSAATNEGPLKRNDH